MSQMAATMPRRRKKTELRSFIGESAKILHRVSAGQALSKVLEELSPTRKGKKTRSISPAPRGKRKDRSKIARQELLEEKREREERAAEQERKQLAEKERQESLDDLPRRMSMMRVLMTSEAAAMPGLATLQRQHTRKELGDMARQPSMHFGSDVISKLQHRRGSQEFHSALNRIQRRRSMLQEERRKWHKSKRGMVRRLLPCSLLTTLSL